MSDVTFGVKVSPEVKEKVSAMIEASGLKSKEWFESLLSLYEMQRLKEGTVDFAKDLGELEIHTNRIVQLVGNMVTRATHEKDAVIQQIEGIKASRDEIIAGYQSELSQLKQQIQEYVQRAEQAEKEQEEMDKHVRQLEEAAEDHRALIGEYKEKIDTLTGLVTQYKDAGEENQRLRDQLSSTLQKTQEQAVQLVQVQKDMEAMEENHSSQISEMKTRHQEELTRGIERAELDKEKALLRLKLEYEDRISKLREDRADKIESLQAEINELRKQIQTKNE